MRPILVSALATLTLATTFGSAAEAPGRTSPARSATTPPRTASVETGTPSQGQQGQLAFIDLATGKLVEPSKADAAALARSPEVQNSLDQSSRGLVEEPVPGNRGYRVKLQGRFQSALVATIGPDGKLLVGHPVLVPEAASKAGADAPKKDGGAK